MKIENKNDDFLLLTMEAGKGNAMGENFLAKLNELCDEAQQMPIKPLILTGTGKIFSAGLELPKLITFKRHEMKEFMEFFENTMIKVFNLKHPTIAAVNGHAIAGGFVLALQADYRFGIEGKSKLGLLEAELGIGLPSSVMESLKLQIPQEFILPIAYEAKLFSPEQCLEMKFFQKITTPERLITESEEKAMELKIKAQAISQIKETTRQPSNYNFQQFREISLEKWLDTWFSDRAQKLIQQKIESL